MGNQISTYLGKNRSVRFWKNPASIVFVFSSLRRNLIVIQIETFWTLLVQCCSPHLKKIIRSGKCQKRGRYVSSIGLGSFFFLLPVFGTAQDSWKYDHVDDILRTQIESAAAHHGIRWIWFCSTVPEPTQVYRIFGYDKSGRLSVDYESFDDGLTFWRNYFFYDDCGQKVRFESVQFFGDTLSCDSFPDRMVDEVVAISEDSISYAEDCLPLSNYSIRAVGDDLMNYVGTLERMPDSVRVTYVNRLSDTTVVVYNNDGLMIRRMIKEPRITSKPRPPSFKYLESENAYDVLWTDLASYTDFRIIRYYIDPKGRLWCGRFDQGAGSLAFRFKYLPGTSLLKEARYYRENRKTYYWFRVEYSERQVPIKVIDPKTGGFTVIRYQFY
jgi:hypothetical protein